MVRIKTILTERQNLFEKCKTLIDVNDSSPGTLWNSMEEKAKLSILKRRRWFRKRLRYQMRIPPLL